MNKTFFGLICAVLCFANTVIAESMTMLPDNLLIENKLFRYYSNVPTINMPSEYYSTFTHVVIIIPERHRGAEEYFGYIRDAAKSTYRGQKTLIISPRFFSADADNLSESVETVFHYWSRDTYWKIGGRSADSEKPITSFEIINQILIRINNNFPEIKNVAITGYSSGGQFVQRYAALEKGPKLKFRTHYVLANPNSYMYINTQRYCSAADCPGYNEYTYGLQNLPSYLRNEQTDDEIRKRLLSRHIILLIGNKDIETFYLDISCEANAQGRDRYNRGLRYYNNINDNYPGHNHEKSIVYGVGDSPKKVYQSLSGIKAIFYYKKH